MRNKKEYGRKKFKKLLSNPGGESRKYPCGMNLSHQLTLKHHPNNISEIINHHIGIGIWLIHIVIKF